MFSTSSLTIEWEQVASNWEAIGYALTADEFAQNLGDNLPGNKSIEVSSLKSGDFLFDLRSKNPDTGEDGYEFKVSLNPKKRDLKLNTFYIVDSANRGSGLGKLGIANLYELAKQEPLVEQISLNAELKNGAFVWAKLGWLPRENDFRKLQKSVRSKLHALQEALPVDEKIDSDMFGVMDKLLDNDQISDPRAIWAIVDSAIETNYTYDDNGALVRSNKPVKVAAEILSWEVYRGALSLNNEEQISRLEQSLGVKSDKELKQTPKQERHYAIQ